jgi:hypothetical protein
VLGRRSCSTLSRVESNSRGEEDTHGTPSSAQLKRQAVARGSYLSSHWRRRWCRCLTLSLHTQSRAVRLDSPVQSTVPTVELLTFPRETKRATLHTGVGRVPEGASSRRRAADVAAGRRPRHPRPGRAVQVAPIKPNLKPPGTKRLKLRCDILPSTSAFKVDLRRYSLDVHWAFMYARDLDANLLRDALAVGLAIYYPPRLRHALSRGQGESSVRLCTRSSVSPIVTHVGPSSRELYGIL